MDIKDRLHQLMLRPGWQSREDQETLLHGIQEIERLRKDARAYAHVALSEENDALIEANKRLTRERDAARAALTEVGNATAVPLPDPNAHSWRAFYDAACTRLTRCADAARRGLRNVEQTVSPGKPVRTETVYHSVNTTGIGSGGHEFNVAEETVEQAIERNMDGIEKALNECGFKKA